MNAEHARSLLYQALETEIGGEAVYQTALKAVQEDGLREEWNGYLDETREHRERLLAVFEALDLDPEEQAPGRSIVRHKAEALVEAMEMAMSELPAEAAELVAGECVFDAEAKDHLNWSLLQHLVEEGPKRYADALREAVEATLPQEAHHRFHTEGWTRELWMKHLGFPAALPPPEEEKSVETRIGAGRAEKSRDEYTGA
ncbi:MAG: hypothetical protein H6744_20325 [Deltaproteobacteria bacterium]|nr:hypothetical protein [Deltaproteobacteria bacterium]